VHAVFPYCEVEFQYFKINLKKKYRIIKCKEILFCNIHKNLAGLSNDVMYFAGRSSVNLKLRMCTLEYNIDMNENKECL
jgi:hypothetical protein